MNKQIIKSIYLLVVVSLLMACDFKSHVVPLKLKEDTIAFEYGQSIGSNISDYLDNEDDVIKGVTVSGFPENEAGKDYPSVGEYHLVFMHQNSETVEQIVYVTDTTAPVLENVKDTYLVDFGKELDINSFKATDLSKITVELQDDDVNYKKAGTYKATVTAKDEYNNETKKEIHIIVKEEEKKTSTLQTKNPSPSNQSTSGSVTTTQPSNNNTSNSSTSKPINNESSSNTQTETKREYEVGNSGMLFDSEEEAINWAEAKMDEDKCETYRGYGYWSTGDKWTVHFKYK